MWWRMYKPRRPSRDTRLILETIGQGTHLILERIKTMAISLAGLKDDFAAYAADVEKLVAQNKADVAKIIADAIAKDDAGETVELTDIQKDIKTAHDKLVVPPFEPSANG